MSNEEPMNEEEIQDAIGSGLKYYKLSTIQPGNPVTLEITGMSKFKGPKYPFPGKDYCYRFTLGGLQTGMVLDVNSKGMAGELSRRAFRGGSKEFQPFSVKIARKVTVEQFKSPYIVSDPDIS